MKPYVKLAARQRERPMMLPDEAHQLHLEHPIVRVRETYAGQRVDVVRCADPHHAVRRTRERERLLTNEDALFS